MLLFAIKYKTDPKTVLFQTCVADCHHILSKTALRRLRICQQSHAATKADTPPIRKTNPIASFDAAGTCIPALRSRDDSSSALFAASCAVSDTSGGAMNANYAEEYQQAEGGPVFGRFAYNYRRDK